MIILPNLKVFIFLKLLISVSNLTLKFFENLTYLRIFPIGSKTLT